MIDIPIENFMGWRCPMDGVMVSSNIKGDPVSNYWNVFRREVYCDAECSLNRHKEITPPKGVDDE